MLSVVLSAPLRCPYGTPAVPQPTRGSTRSYPRSSVPSVDLFASRKTSTHTCTKPACITHASLDTGTHYTAHCYVCHISPLNVFNRVRVFEKFHLMFFFLFVGAPVVSWCLEVWTVWVQRRITCNLPTVKSFINAPSAPWLSSSLPVLMLTVVPNIPMLQTVLNNPSEFLLRPC